MTANAAARLDRPTLDQRMVRTRDALTAALLALLEERPFDQITVREITARAGVGYATFFRHFPGEVSGLLALTLPVLDAKGSGDAAVTLCRHVAAHDRLWAALLTGGAAGAMRDAFITRARALSLAQEKPVSWLPHDLDVIYSVGGTIDILAWWLRQPERLPVEQVAHILNRLVFAPTLQGE